MKRVPKNDSVRFRFRVRTAGGSFLSLANFAISIVVTDADGGPVFTGTGTVLSPDTMAMAFIPADILANPGVVHGKVRAFNDSSDEAYTAKFDLEVEP